MATALSTSDKRGNAAALEVVSDVPVGALTIATGALMAQIAGLADSATEIEITDGASADFAGQCLNRVATLTKQIETARQTVKAPFLAKCSEIDAAAKRPTSTLASASAALRSKLSAWQTECDRRARAEEERRQAELRRIEQERLAAEKAQRDAEEARRQAAAAPVAAANDFADLDDIAAQDAATTAQAEVARLTTAAAQLQETRAVLAPARPAGIAFRTTLKFDVTDVHSLPTNLVIVTANDAAIRAAYCTGWREGQPVPSVPGIRFVVEKLPIANARR